MTDSGTLAWVKGLIPGQPYWVWATVAEEIDRRDQKIRELTLESERFRESLDRSTKALQEATERLEQLQLTNSLLAGENRGDTHGPDNDMG